jgi:hydroxymethylbilane synthase
MTSAFYGPQRPLRIGTRGSPLALAQTREFRDRLLTAHPSLVRSGALEVVTFRTSGDKVQDRRLMEIGGKGLFTKELEDALFDGRIDCAVHSVKDMQTWLPEGLAIGCVLPREDPRDALLAKRGASIRQLPKGATVGTASLRRQAQLLALRPDLRIVPIRGNVGTRLKKLADGEVDATLLAVAGLKRLGLADKATAVLSVEEMLPAVGQGAIGIEIRAADDRMRRLLEAVDDPVTSICVTAERACLAELDGSCHTPIAALAELPAEGSLVRLRALIALPNGTAVRREDRRGSAVSPAGLGHAAARALKAKADPAFFRAVGA